MAVASLRWLAALSATLPIVYADSLPAPTPDIRNDVAVHQRAPAPTGLPVARSLQKRAGEICGYRAGDLSDPYQCVNNGAVCKVNSAASAIGCCAPTGCNIWTACLPFTSSAATRAANLDRTRYCSEASRPHCATLIYTDGQWSGWTINSCAESPTLIAIMDVPSGGVTTTGRIPFTSLEPVNTRTRINPSTSLEPDDTSTRTSPADRAGSTGGVDGENPQPAQSGPPIGAIVGGVVGGVVFLALVGLLIFFLVRGKKKPLQPAAPMGGAPSAQPMYAPVPQGPQSPNNMSQFPHPHAGFYDGKPPVSASVTPIPQPTGSPPPPMYNQQPFYNQAPTPGAGYPSPPQPVSPQFTGQQPVSPQLTGQSQQPGPYQPYAQPAPHQQPPQQSPYAHASELPTQRGDGQLHEVA